jgi:hypothetical protein
MKRNFTAAEALQAVVDSQADGFSAEAEIPSELGDGTPNPQAQNWPDLIQSLADLPIRKGVMTNFAPFVHGRTDVPPTDPTYNGKPWPEKAKPLIDAGWHCLTEAYDLDGDPAIWPARRAQFAAHLGWNITQPGLGVGFGGVPSGQAGIDSYPTRGDYPNWWVWDAGNIL